MISRASVAVFVAVGLTFLAGCSDDPASSDGSGGADTDVTICEPQGTAQAEDDLPAVASVETAMADLEAELGAPQQYFEVNATARLVNLWVALNDGALAQPWVWVDGELSSEAGQTAGGGTFTADDVDFDAETVLDQVRTEVPEAILETFYIHGDGEGNVQYSLLTSAQCGGGLDVVIGADGSVKSVDPVN